MVAYSPTPWANSAGKLYHWNNEQRFGVDETWPGVSRTWNQLTDINYRFLNHDLAGINRTNHGGEGEEKQGGFEYTDVKIANKAIEYLNLLHGLQGKGGNAEGGEEGQVSKPFFLAVGFHQPHEPWHFPSRYWDMYENVTFKLPTGLPPENMPTLSVGDINPQRGGGASWSDMTITSRSNPNVSYSIKSQPKMSMYRSSPRFPPWLMEEGIRSYSASISFMDSQLGRVLDELERLDLAGDTVVAFTSDHGLNVGDYGGWGKRMLHDTNSRVPLIFYDPDEEYAEGNKVSDQVVESIDIFPTLVDMAAGSEEDIDNASKQTPPLEGKSLVPTMRGEIVTQDDDFAISQLVRCSNMPPSEASKDEFWHWWGPCKGNQPAGYWGSGSRVAKIDGGGEENYQWEGRAKTVVMGYSIRTKEWRYTSWVRWNSTLARGDFDTYPPYASELYRHSIGGTDDEEHMIASLGGEIGGIEQLGNVADSEPDDARIQNVKRELFDKIKSVISGKEGRGDDLYPYGLLYPPPPSKILAKKKNEARARAGN